MWHQRPHVVLAERVSLAPVSMLHGLHTWSLASLFVCRQGLLTGLVLSQVIEGLLISPDSQHCVVLFHTRGRQGEMKYGAAVHSLASGKRLSMLSQVSSRQPKRGHRPFSIAQLSLTSTPVRR